MAGSDFYCDEVLSGHTSIKKVRETTHILAFYHTRPYWPVHIIVISKRHIPSLLALTPTDNELLLEMMTVVREIAAQVVAEHGACRIVTNLGDYQDSKHLHWHIGSGQPIK